MPVEGRGLGSRQTQQVVRDRRLGNLATPKRVQKLQTALHAKAKAEAGYRFYALYDKISREDILAHAYAQCRSNKGAPGVDGQDFAEIGLRPSRSPATRAWPCCAGSLASCSGCWRSCAPSSVARGLSATSRRAPSRTRARPPLSRGQAWQRQSAAPLSGRDASNRAADHATIASPRECQR